MDQRAYLTRLYRLSGKRRRALVRAAIALTAASAAVAGLPFRRAIKFGAIPLRNRGGLTAEDCVWAVEAVGRRLPWRSVCIQKGLAVQRLLRSSGIDALLHYGVRRNGDADKLEAHVWVTAEGETIIGGDDAPQFAEVSIFP